MGLQAPSFNSAFSPELRNLRFYQDFLYTK